MMLNLLLAKQFVKQKNTNKIQTKNQEQKFDVVSQFQSM